MFYLSNNNRPNEMVETRKNWTKSLRKNQMFVGSSINPTDRMFPSEELTLFCYFRCDSSEGFHCDFSYALPQHLS